MDFPGSPSRQPGVSEGATRFVVAQEALEHLERNLDTFKEIFEDFHIPTSDYRLLAGFDEDLIRASGHDPFPITYRLPSSLSDFGDIVRVSTRKAAHVLLSSFSTLASNADAGGPSSLGGPSGQGSNGKDNSMKKGKEREDPERFTPPDSSKEGKGDSVSESSGPDSGGARDAEILFRVATHLHRRTEAFQDLQVGGKLKINRIPESQLRFATCDLEFTELVTTSKTTSQEPTYHHFQLNVRIDAKDRWAYLTKIRQPVSTPKYENSWDSALSGTLPVVKPQGMFGASASRTAEQSTSTEKTLNISRIIQTDIGPINSWAFHIADPFQQEVGLPLSPEKLPFVHIKFHGETRAPPPKYLDIEISTYWSLLAPRSSAWLSLQSTGPAFSNLCQVITLSLPSDLQGSHVYDADLLVWPKHSDENPFMCTPAGKIEGDVRNFVAAKVVETDYTINPST